MSPASVRSRLGGLGGLLGLLLLSGCTTFSADGGLAPVAALTRHELGKEVIAIRTEAEAVEARAAVVRLLKRPLTADSAVQIALLNNRGLQAAYNELAIAEAEAVGASLPPNPAISLARLAGAGEVEIERKIIANILALATLPARSAIAADRFRQAQWRAAAETLRIAADARRAFYGAVAARQLANFLAQAQDSARLASELARRLGESGALNKLDQAREQVLYADITTQVAAARRRADAERERLIRVLGLWGRDTNFRLVETLPPLPRRVQALPAIEAEAVRRRLDLQIARLEVEALAKSQGLTQATRFINLLEVSGQWKRTRREDGDKTRQRGIELEFQVPLFDFGEVRARTAEHTYLEAVNRLIEKAVHVRSEARDAYRAYRAAYDLAQHYQREVLPLRKIIAEEMMLRYGAMQVDVFTLLTEARQRLAANVAAIEAHRDFWLAHTDLFAAVVAGGPVGGVPASLKPEPAASAAAPGH